jgi:anti-anti-sigma factor
MRAKSGRNEYFELSTMTEHPPMEITVRESGTIPVLEVRGRLTIGDPSEQLHDALEEVSKTGAHKVIVDLNGVPQIDSSGISALVRISIKLTREGGALRLVCGPGRVRDALTVTRLVEAIPTFDTESAALANFA